MQLVQTPRDALLKPLSTVAGIVEAAHAADPGQHSPAQAGRPFRSSRPISRCRSRHARGLWRRQDNESLTVARKLVDILRALPDSGDVRPGRAGGKLAVQAAKEPVLATNAGRHGVPDDVAARSPGRSRRLCRARRSSTSSNMVHFAMAQQDIRYYLNGMLLVFERSLARGGHGRPQGGPSATAAEGIEAATKSSCHARPAPKCSACWTTATSRSPSTSLQGIQPFGQVELISKLVEGKFLTSIV